MSFLRTRKSPQKKGVIKEMVCFSVRPTSLDSVYKITDELGFLNLIKMNKEIIQTCDAESIILKKNAQEKYSQNQETKPEELINLNIKYYYIVEKEKAEKLQYTLENFDLIEKFSMPEEDDSLVTEEF